LDKKRKFEGDMGSFKKDIDDVEAQVIFKNYSALIIMKYFYLSLRIIFNIENFLFFVIADYQS